MKASESWRPVPTLLSHETSPRSPHLWRGLSVPFRKWQGWERLTSV